MSINNKDKSLPPILIGNGFPASGERPKYYPKDRLIKFLNLNPKDLDSVWEYCRKYIFLPRNVSKGWQKGVQKEHKELTDFAKRAANKTLTEKDRIKINKILRNIHKELHFVTSNDYSNINNELGGIKISNDKSEQQYFVSYTHHLGSIVSLWDDLLKHIIEDQDVRQCLYCGHFFKIAPKSHGQKFCTGTNCQNSYSHNKRYAENKVK